MSHREAMVLLGRLGLRNYYPNKISLHNVTSFCASDDCDPQECIAWKILQRIIMIDFRGREEVLDIVSKTSDLAGIDDFDVSDDDQDEDDLNPTDVFLVIFNCCDLLLKQTLAQKLQMCKLAIPMFYPILDAKNSLMLSFWAMRGVILEWQDPNGKAMESCAAEASLNVVSFIRLGRPEISKSKLMNEVLSDQIHASFLHSDSPQGNIPRSISDGLVEATFYLPSGRMPNHLDYASIFLNLRGNGADYSRQVKLIRSCSSITVIILSLDEFDEHIVSLKEFCKARSNLIVIITCSQPSKQKQNSLKIKFRDRFSENEQQRLKFVRGFTLNGPKSAYQLMTDVREQICASYDENPLLSHMNDLLSFSGKDGIVCDEEDVNCRKGKRLADDVQRQIAKEIKQKPIEIYKKAFFPLQDEPWMKWSILKKSLYRQRSLDVKEKQKLLDRMSDHRNQEVKLIEELPKFISVFIKKLGESGGSKTALFFIKWLKMYLDSLSRASLPRLHQKYQVCWNRLKEVKDKQDSDPKEVESLSKKVIEVETLLANATIGLEHFFREMGQMYESVKETRETGRYSEVDNLPSMMADLFLHGYPIEIMNGESASIPMTWVQAILEAAHERLKDKKVFVLSILGVQSSGKSTFLNTMFGLEFAVSAGRCTRGAFIQLVPLKQSSILPFDYVIVLDTEGLRAPELGFKKPDHDNELATVVIGLADITLMNIKGENYADINDILQIAVQGFLRMFSVKSAHEQRRKCAFIHQNVPAVNVGEKMKEGLRKLQRSLDKLTLEAAKIEGKGNIRNFSQVIDFNGEKHVWYLSDLWYGDPPMAPTNPGYSEKVENVKNSVLFDMVKGQKSFSIGEIAKRVKDLWNAVLSENFVFNFRNSLSVVAFRQIEAKMLELCWDFEQCTEEWVKGQASRKLRHCTSRDMVVKTRTSLIQALMHQSAKTIEDRKGELNDFIEKSRHSDIMMQWKEEKEISLSLQCEALKQKFLGHLKEYADRCILDIGKIDEERALQNEIRLKADKLAEEMKGTMPNETKMRKMFDRLWQPYQDEYDRPTSSGIRDIAKLMESVLHQVLFALGPLLISEFEEQPLSSWPHGQNLFQSISMEDIEAGDHLSAKVDEHETKKSTLNQMVPQVLESVNIAYLNAEQYLRSLSSEETNFETYAKEVIWRINNFVNDINDKPIDQIPYCIQQTFRVKIIVRACRFAVYRFKQMQSEHYIHYSIKGKLDSIKDAMFNIFKHRVKESTAEVGATDLIVQEIEEFVLVTVMHDMGSRVVGDVLQTFGYTKYNFIIRILEVLALTGKFEDWLLYITDAAAYARQWLDMYIQSEYFKKGRYATLAEKAIVKYTYDLSNSLEQMCLEFEQENKPLSLEAWLEILYFKATENVYENELEMDMEKFRQLNTQSIRLADPVHFTKGVLKYMQTIRDSMVKRIKHVKRENIVWQGGNPSAQIFEKIWGCRDHCKYCHEPCMKGHNHLPSEHQCLQHRPQGVIGIRSTRTGVMELHHCNSIVTTNATFSCQRVHPKCQAPGHPNDPRKRHPYRNYKAYMTNWDIAPDDQGEDNIFWQWFVYSFQDSLKRRFSYNLPIFPPSWVRITRNEAIASLRR